MQNITSTPPGDEPRAGEATPAQGDQHTDTPANDTEASAPEESAGPTMGEALDHAWKNRDKATAEAKRLVVEGPSVFRQADLSSKIAVLALLVVLAAFIVNTVLTPRQADQRKALDQIGEAFAGVGEDLDDATHDVEKSNVSAPAPPAPVLTGR